NLLSLDTVKQADLEREGKMGKYERTIHRCKFLQKS
ncbi:hypothetical protein DBR06_SOUSAS3910098, partial [Sousa chinensis]